MAKIPDYVVDKTAQKVQGWMYGIGATSGFFSYCQFANHNGKAGLLCGAVCVGLIWIGSKIKTRKKFKGGLGVYG